MKKDNKKWIIKSVKIISYILTVLLLIAIIGGVVFFTNGFRTDFKMFYAVVDKKTVLTSAGGYTLALDMPLSVDVKYTFGALSKDSSGYSVKIVPNAKNGDFEFIKDGTTCNFSAESDLTAGFNIVQTEKSFTVAPKGALLQVLLGVYPDSEIDFDRSNIDFSKDLFTLILTSGKYSIAINFGIVDYVISGITLDKTEVVF